MFLFFCSRTRNEYRRIEDSPASRSLLRSAAYLSPDLPFGAREKGHHDKRGTCESNSQKTVLRCFPTNEVGDRFKGDVDTEYEKTKADNSQAQFLVALSALSV